MPIEADICLYKAAGKGTEPQTDILNKGFLIKVPFKRLAGTKSAPPRARRASSVPAADGRAGGPCAFTAMLDQITAGWLSTILERNCDKIFIIRQDFKFFI